MMLTLFIIGKSIRGLNDSCSLTMFIDNNPSVAPILWHGLNVGIGVQMLIFMHHVLSDLFLCQVHSTDPL